MCDNPILQPQLLMGGLSQRENCIYLRMGTAFKFIPPTYMGALPLYPLSYYHSVNVLSPEFSRFHTLGLRHSVVLGNSLCRKFATVVMAPFLF